MSLYFVRHAKAGDRLMWDGEDRDRPLSKKGRRQAERLAERFADIPVPRVLSSPFARCIQTVEPLARSKGLAVHPIDILAEGSVFLDVLELLESVPDPPVLCSHGDVIPETMSALVRRGLELDGPEDWRKGVTWVIERTGNEFTRATVWEPPASE